MLPRQGRQRLRDRNQQTRLAVLPGVKPGLVLGAAPLSTARSPGGSRAAAGQGRPGQGRARRRGRPSERARQPCSTRPGLTFPARCGRPAGTGCSACRAGTKELVAQPGTSGRPWAGRGRGSTGRGARRLHPPQRRPSSRPRPSAALAPLQPPEAPRLPAPRQGRAGRPARAAHGAGTSAPPGRPVPELWRKLAAGAATLERKPRDGAARRQPPGPARGLSASRHLQPAAAAGGAPVQPQRLSQHTPRFCLPPSLLS